MATPPSGSRPADPHRRDQGAVELQQDPIAGRGLLFLVLLNGAGALLMLSAFAFGLQSTEPKLVAAMLVFGSGAMTGLLSTFLAYLNRVIRLEAPGRVRLRDALRIAAMVAVIASGASFLVGLNMVGTATTSRSSTHPKTKFQDRGLASATAALEGTTLGSSRFDAQSRRGSL